ncbi:MAG: hypothetical protein ACKN94_07900, partial [Pirellulaceae bacterium]
NLSVSHGESILSFGKPHLAYGIVSGNVVQQNDSGPPDRCGIYSHSCLPAFSPSGARHVLPLSV